MYWLGEKTLGNTRRMHRKWRIVVDCLGELIGAVSIFAAGYLFLLIGHGLGLQ